MTRHEWRTLMLATGAMLFGGGLADGNRLVGLVGVLLVFAWAATGDRERRP